MYRFIIDIVMYTSNWNELSLMSDR